MIPYDDCVKVLDARNNSNANIRVVDSYRINSEYDRLYIVDRLLEYNEQHHSDYSWNRTRDSLLIEWEAHNDIYDFHNNERCKHVDFDNSDEGVSYIGFWARAIKAYMFD